MNELMNRISEIGLIFFGLVFTLNFIIYSITGRCFVFKREETKILMLMTSFIVGIPMLLFGIHFII